MKEKKNGKSKEATVNGLNIIEVPSMSINSNESISVSCYIEGEKSDWMMDTGCSQHITPHKEDYMYYWKFPKPGRAKLASDVKELEIIVFGIVPIGHTMTNGNHLNVTVHDVLYIPKAIGRFFSPNVAMEKGCSAILTYETMSMLTANKTTYLTGTRITNNQLYHIAARILEKEPPKVQISTVVTINPFTDYTLWHRRLGHTYQHMIRNLLKAVIGTPTLIPYDESNRICDGCEKGKSKRPPFPPSKSRHLEHLDLVHCDLDELTQTSIDGYKYTATFLNDATSFGYVALIQKKSNQFKAFKTFKNCAETQLDRKLKRICTDRRTEFFNKKEKEYLLRTWY